MKRNFIILQILGQFNSEYECEAHDLADIKVRDKNMILEEQGSMNTEGWLRRVRNLRQTCKLSKKSL